MKKLIFPVVVVLVLLSVAQVVVHVPYDNNPLHYLNGQGRFTTPAGGGSGGQTYSFDLSHFTVTAETNVALSRAEINLGTIANGGTATLVLSTNVSRAAYSGATATIVLPTITITTNSYQLVHFGTNVSGGSQVISFQSLLRNEMGGSALVTAITNNTGAGFDITFASVGGVWSRVYATGDALAFGGGTVTPSSTDTFTGKTLDGAATGNVLKFKSYLKFNFPRRVDGTGCTYPNTNDFTATPSTFMVPRFSGSAVTNANFCRFETRVPKDWDTSVTPKAFVTARLSAADTGAQIYNIGLASVANSAVSAATVGTWIKIDSAADASGASDDIEGTSTTGVDLTGWTPTPGQWLVMEFNRDGSTDASTVASDLLELEIEYGATQ